MAGDHELTQTQVGDLPEVCLAHAIALTSPRDACRCAAVSPAFRAAADSDHVWRRFLPPEHRGAAIGLPPQGQTPPKQPAASKVAYLRLCDAGAAVLVGGEGNGAMRMWLDKASGAKCYMLSARALSLPWDDGEFSWRWTPHPLSRFRDVAELVECTSLDIYGRLPAAELTPATSYAAYLVYGVAEGHRGLSYPDQETTVALGAERVAAAAARHAVCLHPDEAEARKFRTVSRGTGPEEPRRPRVREDGWSEMEMGRVRTPGGGGGGGQEVVVVSFEVLGWYPKRGLIVEGVEFRPVN